MNLPQNVSRQIQDVFSYQDILWEMQCFWNENIILTNKEVEEEEETDERVCMFL